MILAASVAGSISISAQAAPTGITYDCDTAANHYSELVLPAPSGQFAVKGKVKLRRIEKNTTFAPMTRLVIGTPAASPGASSSTSAGFSLTGLPAKAAGIKSADKNAVIQFVQLESTRESKQTKATPNKVEVITEVPFLLIYDGASIATKASDQSATTSVQLDNAAVQISCSTGEFLFTDLVIEGIPAKSG